jgi:hypothetical protein
MYIKTVVVFIELHELSPDIFPLTVNSGKLPDSRESPSSAQM